MDYEPHSDLQRNLSIVKQRVSIVEDTLNKIDEYVNLIVDRCDAEAKEDIDKK